ncbi:MAG: ABC transporter permease [Pararobbsia sp.]
MIKRTLLSVLTLWLLSVLVFAAGQWLPGNVGRAILGPLADANAVAALNHQLGTDRPLLVQYAHWLAGLARGDLGTSLVYRAPVASFLGPALLNSLKLAGLAFAIVLPLSLLAGVAAALRANRALDRFLSMLGAMLAVVPEFISAIVLILVFAVWLRWLPMSASAPPGAGPLTQLGHLLLPALPLVFVFFGYFARMTRTGTIDALAADYTRTAILKGLPLRTVLWRHVLRNALLPTVTVATTQLGYMIGGLVVVESLFHYPGVGGLVFDAATSRDFPLLEAGVLAIGAVYLLANLLADLLYGMLDPRLREAGPQ